MHEYAQDAMSCVRHYDTLDLFIAFTCNPQWTENRQELFPSQSLAKRGLPRAYILIWFVERLKPNEINDVISAEIPDKE